MAGSAWKVERDPESIAWLTLDKPATSANVLSRGVLSELDEHLNAIAADPPRALVIRSGKPSGFIAGADIHEFTALTDAEEGFELIRAGQRVLSRLEALPCPTVAAIHGFALGGGLELALACRYRVAANDERLTLGLPEVQLGIHPGFGGTVRSVRLLGVRPAMDMMLNGRPVRGERASQLGLIDRLGPPADLEAAARDCALHPPQRRSAPWLERLLNTPLARRFVRSALLRQVERKVARTHYPAPYAIIELWSRYAARGESAYIAEARSIAELFCTPTARELIRVFLLQDRIKALAGRAPGSIRNVHVIGAGVMGGDIAAWCALRGFNVSLQDRTSELVEPALQRAGELFDRRLRDPAKAAAARARLKADVTGAAVPEADVIIEAIFESLNAKRDLYASIEPRMKPQALLATNTSSLMLEPLAQKLARPQRLVGLHFFNPVAQMPLVEVVQSSASEPSAVEFALGFTRKLDKLGLPCRSAPGFVVNRVLMPYLNEAMLAAQEGIALAAIDEAAVRFGMAMGPIELADVVGLDVAKDVGEIIATELGHPVADLTRLKQLVAAKKLGRKTGEGFYAWKDGKPVKEHSAGSAPADLEDRLVLALVNESVACLRDGVVTDPDLIDAAVIFGAAFAPFRGGPIEYARNRGVSAVTARLAELAKRYGSRFEPDAGWRLIGTPGKP
jgi:3-hydroxyacyl-CoA dehydrogenase/enoyl-CoA hydratase/3-hydroxybutyryl-CoA epimerase